jgi:excisionase family DNA binding protein
MSKQTSRARARVPVPVGTASAPPWQDRPYQTVKYAAELTGRSKPSIYTLIHAQELRAVRLAGKTLIETRSLIAFLDQARRWRPDRDRVAAANRSRAELSKELR